MIRVSVSVGNKELQLEAMHIRQEMYASLESLEFTRITVANFITLWNDLYMN